MQHKIETPSVVEYTKYKNLKRRRTYGDVVQYWSQPAGVSVESLFTEAGNKSSNLKQVSFFLLM